jgi:hypothetical protein
MPLYYTMPLFTNTADSGKQFERCAQEATRTQGRARAWNYVAKLHVWRIAVVVCIRTQNQRALGKNELHRGECVGVRPGAPNSVSFRVCFVQKPRPVVTRQYAGTWLTTPT